MSLITEIVYRIERTVSIFTGIDVLGGMAHEEPRVMQLWVEGYASTGDDGKAQKLAEYYAENMQELIDKYTEDNPTDSITKKIEDGVGVFYINGYKVFDNEKAARLRYG